MELEKNILDYYNKGQEKNRLTSGNLLEKIRTLDILNRYLPTSTSTIVDVGGGAGVYSFILSEQGYKVHLIDIMPIHIEQANEINQASKHPLASIKVGDARKLEFDDNSVDVVLLFGPLYHLTGTSDRKRVLEEVYRILKPNGLLFSVGITKFASVLDGFDRKFILQEEFRKIVEEDLKTGQHRNPGNVEHYFTTAFFHDPNQLLIEHVDAGFNELEQLAIEGPLGLLGSINDYLNNENDLQIFLEFSRKIEKEPSLIGSSSHIMIIAKKD